MKNFINCICSIFFLSTLSCNTINTEKIKHISWKYDYGFHLDDIIQFDDTNYRLDKNLFIYKEGKRVASISKCDNKEMIIKSSSSNINGRYVFFADVANVR